MIVPFKPVYFKKTTRKFRYIIIHDYSCRFANLDKAKIDSPKASIGPLRNYNWIFNDSFDVPYHFLCEKIGQDYETLMGTPFCYKCVYDDIPSQYDASIHIAIAGNFSLMAPNPRAYQQMGFRAIASIVRWFKLPFANILMHRDVSTDKESACPGVHFDKAKFMAAIKPMILVKG